MDCDQCIVIGVGDERGPGVFLSMILTLCIIPGRCLLSGRSDSRIVVVPDALRHRENSFS